VKNLTPAILGLLPAALREAEARMAPMHPPALMQELARACALVCGALDQAAREEWLAAAMGEMIEMPADLAAAGLAHARSVADHLSKIIPAALKHIAADLSARRRDVMQVQTLMEMAPPAEIALPTHGESGFFDTTDPAQLLESVRHKLAVGTTVLLSGTAGGPPPLPYRDRSLKIDSPPASDASEALKRMAGVSAATPIDERDHYR